MQILSSVDNQHSKDCHQQKQSLRHIHSLLGDDNLLSWFCFAFQVANDQNKEAAVHVLGFINTTSGRLRGKSSATGVEAGVKMRQMHDTILRCTSCMRNKRRPRQSCRQPNGTPASHRRQRSIF